MDINLSVDVQQLRLFLTLLSFTLDDELSKLM